jgi:hypothetical protein
MSRSSPLVAVAMHDMKVAAHNRADVTHLARASSDDGFHNTQP